MQQQAERGVPGVIQDPDKVRANQRDGVAPFKKARGKQELGTLARSVMETIELVVNIPLSSEFLSKKIS
jgi:hypothetical protein